MREAVRWSMLLIVAWAALWAVPHVASAGGLWSGPSTVAASTGTTPEPDTTETTETTEPESAEPESTPATTEPDEPTADTTIDDVLVGAGDPDSDINTTTAAIAVVGFLALLVLASWWMVRRSNPDAAPMPPEPPSDLI